MYRLPWVKVFTCITTFFTARQTLHQKCLFGLLPNWEGSHLLSELGTRLQPPSPPALWSVHSKIALRNAPGTTPPAIVCVLSRKPDLEGINAWVSMETLHIVWEYSSASFVQFLDSLTSKQNPGDLDVPTFQLFPHPSLSSVIFHPRRLTHCDSHRILSRVVAPSSRVCHAGFDSRPYQALNSAAP
ncbi:hypothetical protein B0H12DRAFT_1217963 [Mycena haematopus]|nr:hypothetical protein B0H12DRAFT_1217963 [Mycena haematopus]